MPRQERLAAMMLNGYGLPTECECCSKVGTPRQQFEHMDVVICDIYATERANELQAEGAWA